MQRITIGRYKGGVPEYAGWIEGVRDDGTEWIMWLDDHGSPVLLWQHRDEGGGIVGEPVVLAVAE